MLIETLLTLSATVLWHLATIFARSSALRLIAKAGTAKFSRGQELPHAQRRVLRSRQKRLSCTWTRPSAVTSHHRVEIYLAVQRFLSKPFYVAETFTGIPDSARIWQPPFLISMSGVREWWTFWFLSRYHPDSRACRDTSDPHCHGVVGFWQHVQHAVPCCGWHCGGLPCAMNLLNLASHRAHSHRRAYGCERWRTSFVPPWWLHC